MPKDRDQQTPADPEDRERLERHRGQGTAGTGLDLLPGEAAGPPPRRMELLSSAFDDGDTLPERFSRDGGNASPPVEWSDVPGEAVELALICEDPDAPRGVFTHWVLTGIDPSVTGMDEDAPPPGAIEGLNDFGAQGWGGPAPPPGSGPHRYVFTLFAVPAALDLNPGSTADDLRRAVAEVGTSAVGQLVGLFER